MKCEICGTEVNGLKGLSIHLKKKHKYSDLDLKNYYDKYFKNIHEGKCYFCGREAIFLNFTKGYHKICDSKECLGKTRATGTYEFLMYKYNLSKDDAIDMQNLRAIDRGKQIKKSLDERLFDNPDFHKEKSHQTKEYWLKRGFSEKESIAKSETVMKMIHEKTWIKRRKFPILYKDVNTTQVDYWLKKGYNIDDAKIKIKNRQTTNILDNYIKKYGDVEGLLKFNERKKNWSNIIEEKYRNGDFSKISKSNYSKPEIDLFKNVVTKINLFGYYSALNNNQYFRRFDNKTYSYDFVYKNKIIEFNGEYWHCNPIKYKEDFYHFHRKMTAKEIWKFDKTKIDLITKSGYNVLVIWENDYKQNPEKIIQQCIDFLIN